MVLFAIGLEEVRGKKKKKTDESQHSSFLCKSSYLSFLFYMNLIILDMEWNQPFSRAHMIKKPVELIGEVIRIGAVKTDETMTDIAHFNMCVRPKFYKKMSFAVGKVTGLKSSSISYGVPFEQAYKAFMEWCGDDPVIFTWGTEDERIMRVNLAVNRMEDTFPECRDLQIIYSRRIMRDFRQYSVMGAVENLEIQQDLKAHDALNDAIYTYRIAKCIDIIKYLPEYPQIAAEIEAERERLKQERYHKSFTVKTDEDILHIRKITFCRCPECRSNMERSMFIKVSEDTYTADVKCETCGSFTVTLSIKDNGDETLTVIRNFIKL